jgi:hypothetical protein
VLTFILAMLYFLQVARIAQLFHPEAEIDSARVIVRPATTPAQLIQALQAPDLVVAETVAMECDDGESVQDQGKATRYAKLYNFLYRGDVNLTEDQDARAKADHAAAEALRVAMQLPPEVATKISMEQKRTERALARSKAKFNRFDDRRRRNETELARIKQMERKKPTTTRNCIKTVAQTKKARAQMLQLERQEKARRKQVEQLRTKHEQAVVKALAKQAAVAASS